MTDSAAAQALRMVEAVADDPARRMDLAAAFYDDRPHRRSITSYRRAELSFMHWQVRRGALNPTSGSQPGSPWWRAINARLLCDSWEAHHLAAGVPGTASRPAVTRWMEFLDGPTPQSWYRAHNTSIAAGYAEYRALSEAELPAERFFMDVTLGRVLFVHGILMNPRKFRGPVFWPLARVLTDPRSRSVDLYLSLRNILPSAYPIAGQSITAILDAENFAGRVIDYGVFLPRAQALYEFAAADLDEPGLRDFIDDGGLTYAWPSAERGVWEPRKSRALIALVARMS
ncbi:MAG: hypothetical protein ABWY93_24685 [Mycobacterium sp.]